LNADKKFVGECSTWIPSIRGYWLHEFEDVSDTIDFSTEGTTIPIKVFAGQRNYGLVGAALRTYVGENINFAASYDFYWNEDIHDNMLYAEVGCSF
jgi:hypothetical protein